MKQASFFWNYFWQSYILNIMAYLSPAPKIHFQKVFEPQAQLSASMNSALVFLSVPVCKTVLWRLAG